MLRTHSSNLAMSVSSSQGFTSSKMDDLAIRVGSKKSKKIVREKRENPKRSMSSSSLLSVVAPVESSTSAGPYFPKAFFTPGKLKKWQNIDLKQIYS
uniref:Uncharacterized protein n=1 Tax=Chelonoidis abingdonii TaxID=106734 RepID=A0A8C0IL88_CHEAB